MLRLSLQYLLMGSVKYSNEPQTIETLCEDCRQSSTFAGSLDGTVQNCPHCSSFVDVGEFEWEAEDESDESDEAP